MKQDAATQFKSFTVISPQSAYEKLICKSDKCKVLHLSESNIYNSMV